MGSVQRGIEVVEFACGAPHLLKGAFSEPVGRDVDAYSLAQPVGVCAGITPFNFPAMVPLWMFPVALACGNTFILKPSEKDPSPSIRMARTAEGGGPARRRVQRRARRQGGGRRAAASSAASMRCRSSARRRSRGTSTRRPRPHGKRVQALGGAKNHAVVLPDADLEFAADAIIGAAYGSAGERCMAISAVVAVGDAARSAGRGAGRQGARAEGRRRARRGRRHGAARHARAPRQGRRLHRRRRREGATLVVDGRGLVVPGHEQRLLPRPDAVRPRDAGHDDLHGRDLRSGAGRRARRRRSRRRLRSSTAIRTATARRSSPVGRAPRGASSRRSRSAWSASTCRFPCRWRSSRSAAGSSRCSATCTCTASKAIKFYTRTKAVTRRWTADAAVGAAFHMPQLG